MAFSAEELAALRAAYAAGVRTVTHGDNSVTYNSMRDLADAIAKIERQQARRGRVSYPAFSRGTDA